MSTSTEHSLRLARQIKASPERVFDAWTRTADLRQWSCPEGLEVADVQVDLQVGGAFLIDMADPEGGRHTAFGEYREIERPSRLVYTWAWKQEEHQVGTTLVTVEFNPKGDGTEVVMTHTLLPTVEARDSHEEGWSSCLNRLEALFA